MNAETYQYQKDGGSGLLTNQNFETYKLYFRKPKSSKCFPT